MDLSKDGMARKQGAAKGVAGNVAPSESGTQQKPCSRPKNVLRCRLWWWVAAPRRKSAHEVEAATKILAVKLGKARRKAQRAASEGRNSQIAHGDLSSGWK